MHRQLFMKDGIVQKMRYDGAKVTQLLVVFDASIN